MPKSKSTANARARHLAIREVAIEKILDLLSIQRMTATELARATNTDPGTLSGYLRYLQMTQRKARPTSMRRAKATLWELGADPSLPSEDDVLDRLIAPKRGIRPAVQIGIPRDPLIAALFGPATQ